MTRRRSTLHVLAAAAALLLSAAPGAGASGPDATAAISEDAVALAERYSISHADAVARLQRQPLVGALTARAAERWPATFAGLWVDHSDGGRVSVAFTSGADAAVAELARDFPRADLLHAVTAGQSLVALEALQGRMIAERELARAGRLTFAGVPGARYDLDIDVRRNTVVVIVDQANSLAPAAFAARYGANVVVEATGTAVPQVCTREDCRYDLRSGLMVTNPDGYYCSTAFTVRRNDNGNKNILSAAHCSMNERRHGGQKYGEVAAQQQSGRVDAERHSVNTNGFDARPWIFVDVDHKSRDVLSVGNYAGLAIGDHVCKSGARTGKTCGNVLGKNYSPSYVTNSERFIKADYCGKGGDSGAGVYDANKALGVHSGGSEGDTCTAGDFTIFGHIEYAENALNASVVTV